MRSCLPGRGLDDKQLQRQNKHVVIGSVPCRHRGSTPLTSTIFAFSKAKMVNEAVRLRFMARSAASCTEGTLRILRHCRKMLHKKNAPPDDEALSLRANMKQLRYEALSLREYGRCCG